MIKGGVHNIDPDLSISDLNFCNTRQLTNQKRLTHHKSDGPQCWRNTTKYKNWGESITIDALDVLREIRKDHSMSTSVDGSAVTMNTSCNESIKSL